MLQTKLVSQDEELEQILVLQSNNLSHTLKPEEKAQEGFLTIQHDIDTLKLMHGLAPSVIIKHEKEVVAYALTMLRECRELIPELESMFSLFGHLEWKGKPLSEENFYVMGQVCVDKKYRGMGLFDQLYDFHREVYRHRFNLLVTEISMRNTRSLRAHERVGFVPLHNHRDSIDNWVVVAWDWQSVQDSRNQVIGKFGENLG